MRIYVNGEEKPVPDATDMASLIERMELTASASR